jgi:hypothetical protein
MSRNPYITESCEYANMKERQTKVIEYSHDNLRPGLISWFFELNQEKVIIVSDYSGLNV